MPRPARLLCKEIAIYLPILKMTLKSRAEHAVDFLLAGPQKNVANMNMHMSQK